MLSVLAYLCFLDWVLTRQPCCYSYTHCVKLDIGFTKRRVTDAPVTPRTRASSRIPSSLLVSYLRMAPRSNTRYRPSFRGSRGGSFRGSRGRGRGGSGAARSDATSKQDDEGTRLAERFEQVELYDDIDDKLGFSRTQEGPKKEGWLVNMHPVECRFSIQRVTLSQKRAGYASHRFMGSFVQNKTLCLLL
jgi:hypothetical protein